MGDVHFDRFTDRARKVMGLARQEAMRFNHQYIGTEHILLGLLVEEGGVAADVLRRFSIDTDKVRLEVEKLVVDGPATGTPGQLPFTPRAKRALELAVDESVRLRHNYIGTEHLLLGLLREGEGIAAQVLMNLGAPFASPSGLRLDEVRGKVLEVLGQPVKKGNVAANKLTAVFVKLRPMFKATEEYVMHAEEETDAKIREGLLNRIDDLRCEILTILEGLSK